MKRETLEKVWAEVHPDLPIEPEARCSECGRGNLSDQIVTEGVESGGEDRMAIADGLYRLAEDIEQFATAVTFSLLEIMEE